jgi:regulator of nucleoside diphosphate kinase
MKAQSGKREWTRGDELQRKLTEAAAMEPAEIPDDVITMNSIARVRDKESKQEGVYNLVFPSDSKPLEGRVSVLSSLGLALFGSRIGDVVEWETPKGLRRLEVIGLIYQPESAQHWTL